MSEVAKWEWEKTEAGRPGMSGDIARLFRREEPKAPGVFALEPLPAAATLLAREVIQNSWDAAREQQSVDPHSPQFEIQFRFAELGHGEKRALVEELDMASLASRVTAIDRAKVGLGATDCLAALTDYEVPLRVLRISERAASGMYGPWDQNKSHMFMALLSIGFTEKMTGAGGSYGYGKAGLINGSRIRSVVAYSCFRERQDDPGVTRRLLGITYWGPHDLEGVNHPGIATLSAGAAGAIRPFENEHADEIAETLGFEVRTPANSEHLGTGFLVIDPSVSPEDLVRAIERWWWPALHEGAFVATVVHTDGSTLRPRPMQDPVLHTFINAWEIAKGRSSPGPDNRYARLTGPARPAPAGEKATPTVGVLGLVSDLTDWSYADQVVGPQDEPVEHKSLVALTRSPRMVVEYREVGSTPPYLRGAFIADASIDDLLRTTEPKAHDSWRTKAEEGEVAPEAAFIADHVIRKIQQTVNNHRTKLRPPVPPPEEVNLPYFNEIMRKVMSGMGAGIRQPIPETRPVSIRLDHQLRQSPNQTLIELVGTATFALSDHFDGDRAPAVLTLAYRFIEDDRVGEHAPLRIAAPEGFTEIEAGVYHGELERAHEARFEFHSAPYDPSWSGKLIVNGDLGTAIVEEIGDE